MLWVPWLCCSREEALPRSRDYVAVGGRRCQGTVAVLQERGIADVLSLYCTRAEALLRSCVRAAGGGGGYC